MEQLNRRGGTGMQLTACEVILFHHEDMGIPWEIAKLGVRQGMWGAVKKIDPGLCAYQRKRESGAPWPLTLHIHGSDQRTLKLVLTTLDPWKAQPASGEQAGEPSSSGEKVPLGRNIPKLVVVGGRGNCACLLACSLDRGLLTKAVIFGVARRFAKIGKRL